EDAPPRLRFAGRLPVEQRRLRYRRVPSDSGNDAEVDRRRLASEFEHAPQRAGVAVGALGAIPLVEPAVEPALVVGEPELRGEARETDEQRRVEDALRLEPGVPSATDEPQPEAHREEARRGRGGRPGRLSEDTGARAVREPQRAADVLARPAQLA